MTSRRLHKTDILWMTLIIVLLVLQFWFPPLRSSLLNDTWSTSSRGKKAFYLLARAQRPSVERNARSLTQLAQSLKQSFNHDTLVCILGASRQPTEQEWQELLEWVRMGGRLLYAVEYDAQEFEIPDLGVKAISLTSEESAEFLRPDEAKLKIGDLETSIESGDERFDWRSGLELSGPAATPILLWDDTIQAVKQTYGQGTVVVVASDLPFSNQSLAFGDNHLLAWRLFEAAGETRRVVFDEYLNTSGTPKMLAILFDPLFRPLTLQFMLLICLYAWWQSHRFGPFLPRDVKPRRNIVDHTDTVGNLFYQQRDSGYPLKIYLQQLVAELHLRQHRGRERRVLEPIAMRMGQTADDLIKLFQQATQGIRSKTLDRKTSARLIASLAQVRQAARTARVERTRSRR